MRIISGKYKAKKIQAPKGTEKTRPIPDRVKLAVFNLLRGHVEGEAVFDGFSGSGAIGIEAASRGASRVVMVEKDKQVARVIDKNLRMLGAYDVCELVLGDALGPIAVARCPDPVHLIFLDPPYPLVQDPAGWDKVRRQAAKLIQKLDDTGYAVIRTPWPFVHKLETVSSEETPPKVEVIDLDEMDDEELDVFDAIAGGPSPSKTVDAEMSIEGAIGPETHSYRHTAVHLYMRDRGE
ncbi:MAG: RsmD family RNA methyltransferase [Planctomycetota bacterium]